MADIGNKVSPNSPTSKVISPSPQEVSQSVPQSGLSPVLAKYKQYLQSCYNARVLAPADKYLPTLECPYINLAMIRRGHYNHEERDEFTRRTLHGRVDQILENKTPINIEDLLTPEDSGRPVRFILVEGPPGIGKSTFAWEVCRRWDEIEGLRDYHTVVLLRLREKWVLNATSLSDLLRYPSHPDFSDSIAEELVQSKGEKLLLVLDGFDEVSHSFHENSVIKSILCRQLLPECTIILTTRPVAKATLESICQPRVDKYVKIIGFTEEERVRYITEVFSKEPELQVNFLKYMFLVPHIKSMMYIPLNCAIIAQVYYESQSSHHLALPRTRTQLYKALTHSLLVRHITMKASKYEYSTSMLPEGLDEENIKKFKILAKFAFDSYHKGESRKVTFFKEDIPEGLVHFGFMNESTEMYAGKGVEQTFSFLHLSLQEYLAAWHLADSYSIEFQVAYHWLAVDFEQQLGLIDPLYKGDNKEEEALISSLEQQRSSLVEPAIFLAGITGWRCQSEDDRNHWEMHLSLDTIEYADYHTFLVEFLYEAQNPCIIPHLFNDDFLNDILIGSRIDSTDNMFYYFNPQTPYACYALSYCQAYYSHFELNLSITCDNDISLLEAFVEGLADHCKYTVPSIHLRIFKFNFQSSLLERCIFWLMKPHLKIEQGSFDSSIINSSAAKKLLHSLVDVQSLSIFNEPELDMFTGLYDHSYYHPTSLEWFAALCSLSKLKELSISKLTVLPTSISEKCSLPPADLLCWLIEHRLTKVRLDIELHFYDVHSPTDVLVDSVLKSVLRSNQITKMELPNISRETMAGVHNILLHCPSLTTLELKRTRLGYDGVLYICSALRNNTTLRCLQIHDELQLPPSSDPCETYCTDLLLELSNIVKDNTLEVMNIQSDPFSGGGDGKEMIFELKLCNISSDVACNVLQTLVETQLLKNIEYCKWLASPESLKHLQKLHISNNSVCDSKVNGLNIEFPVTTTIPDICNTVDRAIIDFIKLNTLAKVALSNISHETMAGVGNILLHCPSLTTLELKRTRLGYDGILYICSALRNNTTLRCLQIHDELQLPPSSDPCETYCTDLLLELSNIVKDNTLEVMNIQCDSVSDGRDGKEMIFELKLCNISSDVACNVLQTLVETQLLKNIEYCKWLASPESLKNLQKLHIYNKSVCDSEVNGLNIDFPMTTVIPDTVDRTINFIRLNTLAKLALFNISREIMAGVHNILIHCPSLTTLELKRTRLGYDGILYICSALRNNTTLRHLVIHDLQLPPSREIWRRGDIQFTSFLSMERVPLPGKTTCTDFLLELNNILMDNTTLKEMKIQSGLFLPLSAGEDGEYCQWTGLGPLQQFNVGAVGSGMSPNLRRSFSSSDLTQPQTTLFWDRWFDDLLIHREVDFDQIEVDFKKLFSKRKEEGKKLFSLPSFTAPDTEVLQSFSGLDLRLKECLEISHLYQYVKRLRKTYCGSLEKLTRHLMEYAYYSKQ